MLARPLATSPRQRSRRGARGTAARGRPPRPPPDDAGRGSRARRRTGAVLSTLRIRAYVPGSLVSSLLVRTMCLLYDAHGSSRKGAPPGIRVMLVTRAGEDGWVVTQAVKISNSLNWTRSGAGDWPGVHKKSESSLRYATRVSAATSPRAFLRQRTNCAVLQPVHKRLHKAARGHRRLWEQCRDCVRGPRSVTLEALKEAANAAR